MTISEADILRYHYSLLNSQSSSSAARAPSSSSSDRRCSNCSHPIHAPSDPTAFTGNTSGIDVVPVRKSGKIKKRKALDVAGSSILPGGTQAVAELRWTAEELGRLANEIVEPQPGANGSKSGVEQKVKKRKKKVDGAGAVDGTGEIDQAKTHKSTKKKVGRPKGSGRKSDPFGNGQGQEMLDPGLDLTALAQRVLSDGNALQDTQYTVNPPILSTTATSNTLQYPSYQHSTPHHVPYDRSQTYMLDPDLMTDPALEMDELSTPSQPMLARQMPRMGVPVYHQSGVVKGGEAAKSRVDLLAGRGKKAGKTGWAVGSPVGYA